MLRVSGSSQPQSFGERVRVSRARMRTPEGQRWTQDNLASALAVKRNTVSRWENGTMLPKDPAVIASLARVLHVSVDWLLAGLGGESSKDIAPSAGRVGDRPNTPYGHHSTAESLPTPAADIVLGYLDRLTACGCSAQQSREAERLLVEGARNGLARRPFAQREMKDIIGDIDAAWDFVTHVLRRQGMRP
jgi:transcriptional regulator with XRE-family HTH domain